MKEVNPEKGLQDQYTDAEFDQAVSDGEARQAGEPVQDTVLTPEDSRQIDSITLMRIYDMLGAILTHLDEDSNDGCTCADEILDAHVNGRLIGPLPSLNI